MELLPHKEFGKLRLHQFVAADDIRALDNWKEMDEEWTGEAVGFTEMLRPTHRPDVVRLVGLDLEELTAEIQRDLWSALKLPLQRGMSLITSDRHSRKASQDSPLLHGSGPTDVHLQGWVPLALHR